jgi:hypothetical protein
VIRPAYQGHASARGSDGKAEAEYELLAPRDENARERRSWAFDRFHASRGTQIS